MNGAQSLFMRALLDTGKRNWRMIYAVVAVSILGAQANKAVAQVTTTYTDTPAPSVVISDVSCGTAAAITRNIVVPTSYIVGDVDIGIFLTHTYRSDLRINLVAPDNTIVNVMLNVAGSGDNVNDLFNDEAAAAITTHNGTVTDPTTAPPPYSHSFIPSALLSAFDGKNAAGTWRITICDSANADVGNYIRGDLIITSTTLAVTKTSSTVSDGVSGANPKSVPGSIVRYCLLATNSGVAGSANHTAVSPTDTIPATATYVAGSLRTGTSCAGATTVEDDDIAGVDETDPFGASRTGATVRGSAPVLAPGASFAVVFNATIN